MSLLLPEIESWESAASFMRKAVSKQRIHRILDAGRRAPSMKNRQEWRFIVINSAEQLKKIANSAYNQPHISNAPVIIATCTTNVNYVMPNGISAYPVDISIAASFMMLQARHEGLSVCPTTIFSASEVQEILSIPFSMRVVMLLPIGYEKSAGKKERSTRYPLQKICAYNHW